VKKRKKKGHTKTDAVLLLLNFSPSLSCQKSALLNEKKISPGYARGDPRNAEELDRKLQNCNEDETRRSKKSHAVWDE
jgi:hypothetical protein